MNYMRDYDAFCLEIKSQRKVENYPKIYLKGFWVQHRSLKGLCFSVTTLFTPNKQHLEPHYCRSSRIHVKNRAWWGWGCYSQHGNVDSFCSSFVVCYLQRRRKAFFSAVRPFSTFQSLGGDGHVRSCSCLKQRKYSPRHKIPPAAARCSANISWFFRVSLIHLAGYVEFWWVTGTTG